MNTLEALVVVSLVMSLGGCVTNGTPTDAITESGLAAHFLPMPPGAPADWFIIDTFADDDGHANGFVWSNPGDPIEQDETRYIFLELMPVVDDENSNFLEAWGLQTFRESNGSAEWVYGKTRGPWHSQSGLYAGDRLGAVAPEHYTESRTVPGDLLRPFVYRIPVTNLTGDPLWFVLDATSATGVEFEFVLLARELSSVRDSAFDTPSENIDDFLGNVDSPRPIGLHHIGSANSSMNEAYWYYESEGSILEASTDHIQVRKTVDGLGHAPVPGQEWVVQAEDRSRSGWTFAYAILGHASGVANWEIAYDVRGESDSRGGIAPPYEENEHGQSGYTGTRVIWDGDGPSNINLQVRFAGADVEDKGIQVGLRGYGMPLSEVLGMPAKPVTSWAD